MKVADPMNNARSAVKAMWVLVVVHFALLSLLATSCDDTKTMERLSQALFTDVLFHSAVPYRVVEGDDGAELRRICRPGDGEPEGLSLRFVLEAMFAFSGEYGCVEEEYFSLRDGDEFFWWPVITPALVEGMLPELDISCIQPVLPAMFGCETEYNCGEDPGCDIVPGTVPLAGPRFVTLSETWDEPLGVAILVDMSGSNKGFVTPEPPYHEVPPGEDSPAIDPVVLEGFADRASDINGARFNVVSPFVNVHDPRDFIIIFGFREEAIEVVCELPGAPDAGQETKRARCFSTDHSLFEGEDGSPGPIDDYRINVAGRSPLWTAVDQAYEYMRSHPAVQVVANRHILVVNDGPDSCAESPDLVEAYGPCERYHTTFEEARARILADPESERIPVHFVQYQSLGAMDRDARQVEIACLTGGYHRFIPSLGQGGFLSEELRSMVSRLRVAFLGVWQVEVPLPDLGDDGLLHEGLFYEVAGKGNLLGDNEHDIESIVWNDSHFLISYGSWGAAPSLVFRRPCAEDADCPHDLAPSGACAIYGWRCGEQDHVCRAEEHWREDGSGAETCGTAGAIALVQSGDIGGWYYNGKKVVLGPVPLRCCHGGCTPPAPPEVPPEYASPGGLTCFTWDVETGWTWDDQLDAWVHKATLATKSGCFSWEEIESKIGYGIYGNPTAEELTFPEHWSCESEDRQ